MAFNFEEDYDYGYGGPMIMGKIKREAVPYYEEGMNEDLDYDEDKDEGKSEFEKYKQPRRLNLADLESNKIYYITFSDAGSEDKDGFFVDIGQQPIRDIRAKLIYIQEPEQITYNVPISESDSKWKLVPKDNQRLKDVFVFVNNSNLIVRDVPPPKSAFIEKLGKSILRQRKGLIIPEAQDIMARASRRSYDKEYDDYVKQKKKELDERMAKILGKTGGKKHRKTRRTKSSFNPRDLVSLRETFSSVKLKGARLLLRKSKRHHKKSRKSKKLYRK